MLLTARQKGLLFGGLALEFTDVWNGLPRLSSLALAVATVAVGMGGAIWLQESRQFPWHLFAAAVFPALMIVVAAGGGPHEANGEAYVGPATFVLAVVLWCLAIEAGRRWWERRHR